MMIVLQIVAIVACCKIVGDKVQERGRRALGYQVMFASLWIIGEAVGAGLTWAIGGRAGNEILLGSLFGAAWGAAIATKIVSMVADVNQPSDYSLHAPGYAPNVSPNAEPLDPANRYASPLPVKPIESPLLPSDSGETRS
jgi:hypothetical protein